MRSAATGRRRLRGLIAFCAIAIAQPARAAEITRVASSFDPDNPFDLDLEISYERIQRRARIDRELASSQATVNGAPLGGVQDARELAYDRVTSRIVPRATVGLHRDLELHVEWPYVLGDATTWRYGSGSSRTIEQNALDPDGQPCTGGACPVFPVGQTADHGGAFGDLTVGLAWGVLSEKRADWAPTWIVSLDVTFPTAAPFDPAADRAPGFVTAYAARKGPVGQGIWRYDFSTAVSRRIGRLDPYVRAHVSIPQRLARTFSNCGRAQELAAAGQMSAIAPANCALPAFKDEARAQPPLLIGFTLGTEIVPYEDLADHQRVVVDVRLGAEYTGASRWYNELSDATGKILWTDPYLTLRGLVGLHLRASSYVQLRAVASVQHDMGHLLTGEHIGARPGEAVAPGSAGQNPNYDFRLDLPGRRFRLAEALGVDFRVTAALSF